MPDSSQVKELTAKLEQGVKDLFNTDTYAEYLKTMSRFHKYSTRNTVLIHSQYPKATLVAGFQSWKNKFERNVVKGAKAIKILAPVPFTKREEKEKIDPDTNRPIIGDDGLPVVEVTEQRFIAKFNIVNVFDVSQTQGKPLPTLVQDLTGNVEQYEAFMDALHAVSPLPIVFEPMAEGQDGYCRFGEKIAIREGMSEIQTVCAVIHEITHSKLHDMEALRLADPNAVPKDRRTEEIEAESVSYAVNQFFNIETGANSIGYVAEWSRGRELKELNASLDTIRKTAAEMIDAIDGKFQEIVKERNISFAVAEQQTEIVEPPRETEMDKIPEMPELSDTDTPGRVYAYYSNIVANRASEYMATSRTLSGSDEAAAREACNECVKRVVNDLLQENGNNYRLYRQYTENHDFKARLEDYAFIQAYLEPKTAERNAATKNPAPQVSNIDISEILAEYARNAEVRDPLRVGANVLMTSVFHDMNFNRDGKKIRVTVEEPAGKYQLFSRDEFSNKMYYLLTASGRIDRLDGYFPAVWDETQHKRVSHRPTETELDAIIPQIAERFETDMANPTKWALYQHAAVLNRIDECEAHNTPVRELRNAEKESRRAEAEQARKEEERLFNEKYDNRVDEIARALEKGEVINVAHNEYEYGGKNPVLDLFKLYGVDLPLRTQGWVNTGLAEISDHGYRFFKSKHKGNSSAFGGYLIKLRLAIRETPIEQKRGNPENSITAAKEARKTVENNLYEKFTELFPQIESGEYRHLRLESDGRGQPSAFEPLSVEWIGDNRLSIMHTYTMNGDLMYDPMITFDVDREARTMTAVEFEQSMPPMYQRVEEENGDGRSIDGNGRESMVRGLRTQINEFSEQWFENIEGQDYMPVRGAMEINGGDIRVTFDADGQPIMPETLKNETAPEAEKSEKQYDLGYGFLGNGITVWNRAEEVNGDYKTVAHIETDRTVKFYDKDMPHDVRQRIDSVAKSPDTQAFDFAPAPENIPPRLDNTPAPASVYEAVKRVFPEATQPDLSPDPSIGVSEMNLYGYEYEKMLPLTTEKAVELFDGNHCIYLLYPDNTEGMALDRDEILNHDGICGIESEDWERSPVRAAKLAAAANVEGSRESELLYGGGNRFGIYQIRNDIDEARDFRFAPLRELNALGLGVDRDNYELVYTAPFSERVEFLSDRYPVLNKIYQDFNVNQPADYTARSVSVSDVIVLKYNEDISSHFVDSAGFKELDAFIGDERQNTPVAGTPAQDSKTNTLYQVGTSSDEYKGATVTELESAVNAGKIISLTDLSNAVHAERANKNNRPSVPKGKPSTLMERLNEGKRKAGQQGQTDANNKKREGIE